MAHERAGRRVLGTGVAPGEAGRGLGGEVAVGLARLERPAEEHGVGAGRGLHGELVESEALAPGADDARARALGEAEGADAEGRDLDHAGVVGDGAHHNADLGLLAGHVARDARQGHGGAVGARHVEALEDDLVELGVGAAGEEPVELDDQPEVHILGLGLSPVLVADVAAASADVNTHVLER